MVCRPGAFFLLLCVGVNALICPGPWNSENQIESLGRREALGSIAVLGTLFTGAHSSMAVSQEEIDKANIVKGYKRLTYLLDNWEEKTTNCK